MYRTFASLILAAVTLVPSASAATGAPAIQSDTSLLQLVQYSLAPPSAALAIFAPATFRFARRFLAPGSLRR